MKTKDVISHFKTAANIARALHISRQAVGLWGEHPPLGRQFQIELLTGGKLKASQEHKNNIAQPQD